MSTHIESILLPRFELVFPTRPSDPREPYVPPAGYRVVTLPLSDEPYDVRHPRAVLVPIGVRHVEYKNWMQWFALLEARRCELYAQAKAAQEPAEDARSVDNADNAPRGTEAHRERA
jgi:hypothetical protein